nr:MAG TPA: hypothetical protein [Caudoviricetes sp.]
MIVCVRYFNIIIICSVLVILNCNVLYNLTSFSPFFLKF